MKKNDINDELSGVGFKQKKRVLAVDDDRTVLKLLKAILEQEYEFIAIASGKMAEQYLETKTADIILLDYDMPDVSGSMIFRNLKASPRTAGIPVVFLTGVTDMNRVRHVLSYKPNGYLLKPIDVDRLKKTIKEILG